MAYLQQALQEMPQERAPLRPWTTAEVLHSEAMPAEQTRGVGAPITPSSLRMIHLSVIRRRHRHHKVRLKFMHAYTHVRSHTHARALVRSLAPPPRPPRGPAPSQPR